jgi:hypothetical protein
MSLALDATGNEACTTSPTENGGACTIGAGVGGAADAPLAFIERYTTKTMTNRIKTIIATIIVPIIYPISVIYISTSIFWLG